MKQYLYINISDLKVVKCSPVNKPKPGQTTIEVDDNIASIFNSGHIGEINNYVVVRNDEEYSIIPKALIKNYVNKKIAVGILQEAKFTKNADCNIIINNVAQTITLKLNLLQGMQHINYTSEDLEDNTNFIVYITKKNDPSYLLFYIKVPMVDLLLSPKEITKALPTKYTNVSVYTRYVSSTYSLEFINE